MWGLGSFEGHTFKLLDNMLVIVQVSQYVFWPRGMGVGGAVEVRAAG